ncbi:60S ribosomal protein L9 [Gurleya vavrai]
MKLLLKQETVQIPENVQITLTKKHITISCDKVKRSIDLAHLNLTIEIKENEILISLWNGSSREQSKVNTCASIIKNAINGVLYGFNYTLKAASVHFPIAMEVHDGGKTVFVKNFLGEKNVRKYQMRGEVMAKLGEEKDTLVLEGNSIEDVSQCAGLIVDDCRVRKYDNRVFLDGIYVMKKGLATEAN